VRSRAPDPAEPIPLGTILIYSLPGLPLAFTFTLVLVYAMKYATDVLLVPTVVMGALFGLSRVWDALTDPIAGHLSDRTRSRLGRRRSWLLASARWAPFHVGAPRAVGAGATSV
jgi:GPH family glycoside/pentoside/hexuronide:cation symporter